MQPLTSCSQHILSLLPSCLFARPDPCKFTLQYRMVFTHNQSRLSHLYGHTVGSNAADSGDSEISFGPAYFDRLFLGGQQATGYEADHETDRDTDESPETSMEGGDDRQERRLQLLESAVMRMTEKFDSLLLQISHAPQQGHGLPSPHAPHGPSAAQGQHGVHGYQTSRPTPLDPRHPPYSDYVVEQLCREGMSIPRVDDGKALVQDMFVKTMIPKAYMYLDRPGANTIKKKLDLRDSMTFHEYMSCFIKMIRDPLADQARNSDTLLEHLQQVVQDVAVRDWRSVRRWSQHTFDAMENGSYWWEDRPDIQFERFRYALMAARPTAGHQQQ